MNMAALQSQINEGERSFYEKYGNCVAVAESLLYIRDSKLLLAYPYFFRHLTTNFIRKQKKLEND